MDSVVPLALHKQERLDSRLFRSSVRIDFIITIIVDTKVLKGIVHGQIRDSVGRDKIFISERVH